MHPIILPVQSDENLKVFAYPEGGGIKIGLREGGYLNVGLFRAAYHKKESIGQTLTSGPVTAQVIARGDGIELVVTIKLPHGTIIERTISPAVCDELAERVSQADMLLYSYVYDDSADVDHSVPKPLPLEQAVIDTVEKE
ncbi:MAG: hypothetical protein WCT10_03210 [Patescibacteria group bacterium]|jgi:hypothetical protein